jgi:cytoskeletal protein CcmA (bactofilin family)
MAAENATVIGKSVQIRGEVNGSEDLLVDGQVEGTVTLSESRLTIGPHANVTANVSARDVILLGRLNGNVRATGRVELRKGCDLVGDIVAGRLSIEENALFRGKVDLVQPADKPADKNAAAMAASVSPTAKPAAAEPSLFKAPVQK